MAAYLLKRYPVDCPKEVVGHEPFLIILASIISAFGNCAQAVPRLLVEIVILRFGVWACFYDLSHQIS